MVSDHIETNSQGMARALLNEQVTSAFFASTDPVAMAVTMKMDYA